jgi:hypothetical protein
MRVRTGDLDPLPLMGGVRTRSLPLLVVAVAAVVALFVESWLADSAKRDARKLGRTWKSCSGSALSLMRLH